MAPPRWNEGQLLKLWIGDVQEKEILVRPEFGTSFLTNLSRKLQVNPLGVPVTRRPEPDNPESGYSVWQALVESHLTLETWPESGALRVDIDSCKPFYVPELREWVMRYTKGKLKHFICHGGPDGYFPVRTNGA